VSPLRPRVGDLTDPLYFDFIAYAQFAALGAVLAAPQSVFQEFCDECPEQRRTVRRDAALADAALPAALFAGTGDLIYAGLREGFRGVDFGVPPPPARGAGVPALAAAAGVIADALATHGLAIKAEVSEVAAPAAGAPGGFTVTLRGGANLWGLQALAFRRAPLLNAYDAMAIDAMLRAAGVVGATHETAFDDAACTTRWTLPSA
jgi:hypothetical protein